MISQREAYQTYQRCGSVHLTAEALGQKPADVREKLKRYMESRGLDASRFHQPTQTEKIEAYSAQSFKVMRERMNKDTTNPVYVCDIDGQIKAVSENKAAGTLIGVYEKGVPTEYMRDDIYWYITNYMEADDDNL